MSRRKCSIDGWIVSPCKALLTAASDNGNGIRPVTIMNARTGETTRELFAFYGGRVGRQGRFLNYCPWCGEAIVQHPAPDDAARSAREGE